MDMVISKIFLVVARRMINEQTSSIDQSMLSDLEKKVTDSEKKQKVDSLPVYVYHGDNAALKKQNSAITCFS